MSCEPALAPTLKIACLGWGSLVWAPRKLPIWGDWFKDGPFAPVEFTRQSSDGRMTLVIDPTAAPIKLLWAHMRPVDLLTAQEALRNREGITARDWLAQIGSWQHGDPAPVHIPNLPVWAEANGLDAVVWTALAPRFGITDKSPSAEKVIEYLRGLHGPKRERAKQYIECAPRQIDTNYRRQIEAVLGWPCRSDF